MHNNHPSPPMGLSLHTSLPSESYESYDYSTSSPLSSSTTTSSSPSRRFRRSGAAGATGEWTRGHNHHDSISSRSRSQSPLELASSALRRSSLVNLLLRRRPSKVDLALSEERSRCDEDVVERQGLRLMEPRPVVPVPAGVGELNLDALVGVDVAGEGLARPLFVMGGIEEVMEGKA